MTFKIDTDFALPLVVAFLAVTFTIGYQTLIPRSSIDQLLTENDILFQEVSSANHEVTILTKELESYSTTASQLESLGASHTQAVQVIKAAEVYNLDPKH